MDEIETYVREESSKKKKKRISKISEECQSETFKMDIWTSKGTKQQKEQERKTDDY